MTGVELLIVRCSFMKKILVYLDNCCFNRPYDVIDSMIIKIETISKLAIQDEIRAGKIELAWSYMLDYENDSNPNALIKWVIGMWNKFAAVDIDETLQIIRDAEEIENTGIKQKDALHIACAIAAGCDYFITVDNGILKKKMSVTGITIINPIDYFRIKEVDKNEN